MVKWTDGGGEKEVVSAVARLWEGRGPQAWKGQPLNWPQCEPAREARVTVCEKSSCMKILCNKEIKQELSAATTLFGISARREISGPRGKTNDSGVCCVTVLRNSVYVGQVGRHMLVDPQMIKIQAKTLTKLSFQVLASVLYCHMV